MSEKVIANYYMQSSWLYKYFWYSSKSLGLNYGIWRKDTKNRHQAILNMFQYIVDLGKISNQMKVLDAGCGVGGGAIYIARKTGAQVVGITITPSQVIEAEKNAKLAKIDNLVKFTLMDYTQTTFPDNYFDVVYGIESICYAYPKSNFLKESHRILKKNGKLIISDGYLIHKPRNLYEKEVTTNFCKGWKLEEMVEVDDMTRYLKLEHFNNVILEDMTPTVGKSLAYMKFLVIIAKPFAWIAKYVKIPFLINIRDNVQSMEMSIIGVEIGLFGHFTHIAKK